MTGFTFAELADEYEAPEQTVTICIKGSIVGQLEHLQYEYVQARMRDQAKHGIDQPREAPALAEQIEHLQAEAARYERQFRVRSLGEKAWADLSAQHPPTSQQRDDGFTWNPHTFMPVAIAACSVVPPLTDDEAVALLEMLSSGQVKRLWGAILECNGGGGVVPKFVVPSAPTPSSTTS